MPSIPDGSLTRLSHGSWHGKLMQDNNIYVFDFWDVCGVSVVVGLMQVEWTGGL
jgi:hypothetical protein